MARAIRRNEGSGAAREKKITRGAGAEAKTYRHVELYLHAVTCVKTTKELDRDEIVVAAIRTGAKLEGQGRGRRLVGASEPGRPVDVGKFRRGDVVRLDAPKLLVRLPFGAAGEAWPRTYLATLLLIEEDEGALGTLLADVAAAIDERVTEAVTAAAAGAAVGVAAGAAAGSVVPLVGTAVGAAAGAAVGAALGAVEKAKADDCFPPRRVLLELGESPGESGRVAGSRTTTTFRGFQGEYEVVTSWSVA